MSPDTLHLEVTLQRTGFTLALNERIELSGSTAIFGPSGAGKSTLLRVIAGFETAVAGRIALDDDCWLDSARGIFVPPHHRPFGLVFQDARLFPHLDVAGNLAFASRRSDPEGREQHRREVVSALDLQGLLSRRVASLSGGEQQRAALGRTLLTRPKLLLLDEPLSALDPARKADILPYLESLHARFGIPTLYVSHSLDEVTRLAEQVLVLNEGQVVARGRTEEILKRLDLQSITGRYEFGALIDATLRARDERLHLDWLDVGGQTISMPATPGLQAGTSVRLRIRARDVALARSRPSGISIRNILQGRIIEIVSDADSAYAEILLTLAAGQLRSRITRAATEELQLRVGEEVYLLIKTVSLEGLAS